VINGSTTWSNASTNRLGGKFGLDRQADGPGKHLLMAAKAAAAGFRGEPLARSLRWPRLITSVRRRRDFAIMRALGFTSRQVRGTLCWQALTLAGIALVIGVPAGIACGRLRRQVFARLLGITPIEAVLLAVLAIMPAGRLAGRRGGDRRAVRRGGHEEPPGPDAAQRVARHQP
jgi:hypothetical protein